MSKYIGETEKNLERVFVSASSSNALLFFDEANALFGKRSEVKDSHDRYANIEIAYLLERMEQHDSLAILATNVLANVDEAFTRRARYIVEFPFPDRGLRRRLWEAAFPSTTPVAELDFEKLAERRLTGGQIRAAVLRAAFLAAESEGPVAMSHIATSLEQDALRHGRSGPRPAFTPRQWRRSPARIPWP